MTSEMFTFGVGDTVILKSGSRYMSIAEMEVDAYGNTSAVLVWMVWDTGMMQTATLPANVLCKPKDRADAGQYVQQNDRSKR